jgi:NADH-quinone oxidoreductase subunit A
LTYFDAATIFVYIGLSATFLTAALVLGSLLRPKNPYAQKLTTYECGEDTIGSAFIQFNVRFYIVALIFLIFDVEVAALFPWATVFSQFGPIPFIEMLTFIGILLVGFAYVWVKGDLEWIRSLGQIHTTQEKRTTWD